MFLTALAALLPLVAFAEPATPRLPEQALEPTKCQWCVANDEKARDEVSALGQLAPAKLLSKIRAKGVCVKIMDSRRPVQPGRFGWGQVEKAKTSMSTVPKIAALMGKMICKGEHELAKSCPTIVLASDAPYYTLLYQYIHHLQNQRDPAWCATAKRLWNYSTTGETWRLIRNREWDDYALLWHTKDRMKLRTEDKIAIGNALISEAEQRRVFDRESENFLTSNRVSTYISDQFKILTDADKKKR